MFDEYERHPLGRRRQPTGPAFGRPDDRLRRAIRYSRDGAAKSRRRGVLDARMRGV
jgi:hypothetical protein